MADIINECGDAVQSEHQFCLRWNDHQSTLVTIFEALLDSNTLVDCTLAAEGQFLRAHKIVLSACSPYFQLLLSQHTDKHPIVILKDVKYDELKAMIDYMYRGEVNIPQDQLGPLLKTAESLQIRGLGVASSQDDSDILERPINKSSKDKERSGERSPQPRSYNSAGILGEIQRNNQSATSRKGSESPTPRKRLRHLHPSDSAGSQSPITICDPPSRGRSPLIPEISSGPPPLAPLSGTNRTTAHTRLSDWPERISEKPSPLPTTSIDIGPSLASLSSFSSAVGDNRGDRKWSEREMKNTSSLAESIVQSGTVSGDSEKLDPISEILLVPKTEYVDVEDESLTNAMLDDVHSLETSGPSHAARTGDSAAFVPWLENIEGVADEPTGQEVAAAYRATQGSFSVRKGNTCCSVAGCTTSYRNTGKSIKFYRFPARQHDRALRQMWIDSINRNVGFKKPWQPSKYSRICSIHFVGNRKSFDARSPSYVPTIFLKN